MTYALFEHQKKSIEFMRKNHRVYDASSCGTGKTLTQIALFQERRRAGGKCALVIAPKSLLRAAWEADFKKFAPEIVVQVCPAESRVQSFAKPADVYVTNVDATVWLGQQHPEFFDRFDTLILDEMSAFKHHTSKRSKALVKIRKYFKYRYGMSGTPSSNNITDIWNQIYVLDDGARLGASFFGFRSKYQAPRAIGPIAMKWEDRPGAEIEVGKLIQDMVVRHKFEDCVDIPANHSYSIPYALPPKSRHIYKEFARDAVAMLNDETALTAINAAGVANKLLQISSGAVYTEDGYTSLETDRYELVADLVDAREHCVVFFHWKHQKANLIKEFEKRGLSYAVIDGTTSDGDRTDAVKDFQNGFYRVILAHPASAAHGLTLTRGTCTIWASPTYNLEHWLQGNQRIYRAGQKQKTETICVMAPGTIEEQVLKKLESKNSSQTNILELLKEAFQAEVA